MFIWWLLEMEWLSVAKALPFIAKLHAVWLTAAVPGWIWGCLDVHIGCIINQMVMYRCTTISWNEFNPDTGTYRTSVNKNMAKMLIEFEFLLNTLSTLNKFLCKKTNILLKILTRNLFSWGAYCCLVSWHVSCSWFPAFQPHPHRRFCHPVLCK